MGSGWRDTVDQVGMGIKELFSSLHSELGAGLAMDPSGLLLLISAGLGLLITAVLWISVRRGSAKARPENIAPDSGKPSKPKAEEPKKRSRKRAGDKKLQRNGLLSPGEELKPVEPQNQNESSEPAGGKSDKGKKNKKKAKGQAKEIKSSTSSEHKEAEEVGSWETKVSHREKRQQRRKDKGPGDGSPGEEEPNAEPAPDPEEPQITVTPTVSSTKPNKNPKSTKNPIVLAPAAPKPEEPPPAEAPPEPAVKVPVSQVWEDELNVGGSGWRDLGASVPAVHTWNSVSLPCERQEPEPSIWPQDMEGSWTIVDGSHIPVSFHGLSGGVETLVVPDLSWSCHTPVDDEWSGINRVSADPESDWRAPPEEWGNYEDPAGGAAFPEELQESDPEKDKDEVVGAPGSGKAKKKKKRKKKADEAGAVAQAQAQVGVNKDRSAAESKPTTKESVPLSAPPRVVPKPPEPEAPPKSTAPHTQKKAEESWESPKQVKKKKARRET